ncbi:class I SAM-dependent methyltransferase [Polycladidibacter hongkongensis]|uniref:class I SAM-dependent methyltransferase n=1 Tax=Polycladidibacter hongkongensis TaxID=1647556 RepID=UPI00082F8C03|nr:class I SAM-dependent methyltransferase [Pseudovibrio hongkongensis]
MPQEIADDVARAAGAAVYSSRTLKAYDFIVHGFSNRYLWKVRTAELISFYSQNMVGAHLDVGVGSGYFLEKCAFKALDRLVLMDRNRDCLEFAAERAQGVEPELLQADAFEPVAFEPESFDSVCLGYLLHCLPGSIADKAVVFDNLLPLLKPGAVLYGATILGKGLTPNWGARKLMALYNEKGVFCNLEDTLDDLQRALDTRFDQVDVKLHGNVALFKAIRR